MKIAKLLVLYLVFNTNVIFLFIATPSEDEIKHFLEAAGANDLVVVPLVQTFGHLEVIIFKSHCSCLLS